MLICSSYFTFAQNLTSSPYSRYGFGELNSQTFAAQAGMGNSFIAYHQDSIAPFFINAANPAGLSGIVPFKTPDSIEFGVEFPINVLKFLSNSIKGSFAV